MAGSRICKKTDGVIVLILILLVFKIITGGLVHPPPANQNGEEDSFVQIEGDVKYPGVYGFKGKTRLQTLIEKAGGLQPPPKIPVNETVSRLYSGERIVARHDQGAYSFYKRNMPSYYKITLGIPISLNEESEAGLTAVPGIGPQLAGHIVHKRNQKGGFESLNELLTIEGMGVRLYHKVKSFLKIQKELEKTDDED